MATHVFTSVTSNYIPKARVLAESIKRVHPEMLFHLILVDAVPPGFRIDEEPFDFVEGVYDLDIKNAEQWLFKHSVVEACTGVKGFALTKLLSQSDCSAAFYFDPDIVVLSSLEPLLAEFERGSVLLTPHLTEPERTVEAIMDNELSALQHGIYNLGFLGVKKSGTGLNFARWWAERLKDFCYDDIPRGVFTDQRWIDLAPGYFDDIRVLRGPEYNVSTWNLTHRAVKGTWRSGFSVNGRPIVFYHFSGLDSGAQEAMLEKYGAKMPALYELREWYLAECARKGQGVLGRLPWRYGTFDNGRPVTALHRQRYRDRLDLQDAFPDPYATTDLRRSYYHWFEKNDESRLRPPSKLTYLPGKPGASASRPAAAPQPAYRIFLAVCNSLPEDAIRLAKDLAQKSFRGRELYAVGAKSDLAAVFASSELSRSFQQVPIEEPASHDSAFAAVANQYGDTDFVFVTPAVSVGDLWDLRLAWTSRRIQGAATVSPINDSEPHTRLSLRSGLHEVDEIDAACYEAAYFANPEIPGFVRQCVYVNHRALVETGQITGADDFSAKASQLRWSHILADHVYTGTSQPADTTLAHGVIPPPSVTLLRDQLTGGSIRVSSPATRSARRQLHVMHSWGGGLEQWVRGYCEADYDHRNLVLKSIGTWGAFGMELRLYESVDSEHPIQRWNLSPAIKHTASEHPAYRAAMAEIAHQHGIDAIMVSSLVGHSLDVLRTGLPTLMVCHDYYPFCPALNVTFADKLCRECGQHELERCTLENVHHRFFRNVPSSEWIDLRAKFSSILAENGIRMIAPSESVRDIYSHFMPEHRSRFQIIPHGTPPFETGPLQLNFRPEQRLRIVMLGAMAPHKGLNLLTTILPELLEVADVYLLGCGDAGEALKRPGVTIIPSYVRAELPGFLQSICPDVGLLLSVVPETFSYTLQEMLELGIPPVATRIGSFADRIQDGVNGFLVDADPGSVMSKLRELSQRRDVLKHLHQHLCAHPPRVIGEMLADYEALLDLPSLSERAYFSPSVASQTAPSANTYVQLLWKDAASEFREEASTVVPIQSKGTAAVHLRIPEQPSPPMALRLDLGQTPGFVVVFRMRLLDNAGETIWSWQSREGPLAAHRNDLTWLGGTAGSLIHLQGSDPHLLLPIPEAQLAALERGGSLAIDMEYPTPDEVVGRLPAKLLSELGGDALAQLSEPVRLDSVVRRDPASSDRLLHQLAWARTRVSDLEQSLSWRLTAPLRWGGAFVFSLFRRARIENERRF